LAKGPSKDAPPVLTRLCCFWSESDGERDLLRLESTSGMVAIQFKLSFKLRWIWDVCEARGKIDTGVEGLTDMR